jgi:uncharacterized protein (DUF2126 family)/transglutaminase-like putative cysteine protease
MAIHIALYHKTHYTYDQAVSHGPHTIRLRPAPHCRTKILSYSQHISGGEHFINWQQDPFSNWNARVVFQDLMRELCVEIELVAEMAVYNPFDFFLEEAATHYPFAYETSLKKDLARFLEPCPLTPRLLEHINVLKSELLSGNSTGNKPLRTIDFLVAVNRNLQHEIKYLIRLEPGVQTPEETLEKRSGSCRDSAWLAVQVLRQLGLAARFVSGYLIQLAPDVKSLDGPSGAEADFTDLHAWCEVYLPGAGWIGFDPTSGLLAGEGHIPLSCTPEPSSAAPVTGILDKCNATLHHEMRVCRIYESPRVTKPYTEEQWQRIEQLGHAIDTDLVRDDVRLTMGGEPTFISIDNPDGAEWNFIAHSREKRVLSGKLIKRLRSQFAPGSLLHFGQGKWYPGEQLPRWALAAYWRKDGVPIWNDDSLIADESISYGFGAKEAHALAARIAEILGVDPKWLLPAYEDAFYYTWKERRLPSNVTPKESNLRDELERDRITRLFQKGLGEIVGYALPIGRVGSGDQASWTSGPWFLRDDDLLWLLPGDSPMGLRLPLDSIPWVAEKDYPWIWQRDPSEPLPALPSSDEIKQRYIRAAPSIPPPRGAGWAQNLREPGTFVRGKDHEQFSRTNPAPSSDVSHAASENVREESDPASRRPALQESAPWIIRTALCVEPRDGRLHIYMPPVATAEEYLALVAAIEIAVTELAMPVIIEGETPPKDPRLNKLAVTPDPGVIEVNLHPSASWDELVRNTTVLYEEARQTRLGTEKFMIDGRHTGTGGGNHIIIGGQTPADSPILRRPDVLRSLLTYWQNHPSLSWLFSSLFIGPTSQAPRIDEARHDSLYELEIAFNELDRQLGIRSTPANSGSPSSGRAMARSTSPPWPRLEPASSDQPWLVDRLFRNLLLDAAGNTHRSEFSIDKLYAPETSTGRLGLVEMRAFEMPPHARMSLAQHLLLRGLIATFWREPCTNPLVRWGTDLHDRWMLPHFCQSDFSDVLRDLRQAGYPFELEWFAPHFEFRFPRIGEFTQRDVHVELRTALEPWHVLGEEPGPGGTVRYVDSSLERLQVKARGLIGDRFAITCNGHRLPLHPTGANAEAVAGVRYRAWQPAQCLQPTIEVHTPLVFDLFDTWNGRSLGGCTYHVTHPGGQGYSTFPVNAYEAESRRFARFSAHGHTQGRFAPPPARINCDFPFTLDLRTA